MSDLAPTPRQLEVLRARCETGSRKEAAALLPAGRLVVIPGSAHIVHFAAPDAFVAVVRPFLEAME